MTVSNGSNIYDDVMHLIDLDRTETEPPLFDHVHWQMDVLWDSPKFARWDNFLKVGQVNKYLHILDIYEYSYS